MKTTVTYEDKTYTERDNQHPAMITRACNCGNVLTIPVAAWVLGLVTDCGHCHSTSPFPATNHSAAITQGYKELIAEGGNIEL